MQKSSETPAKKRTIMRLEDIPAISEERLAELATLSDEEIDTSDIPELGNDFWEHAVLVPAPGKERLTLRLDNDVLDYFKQRGRGYQTRINAVLRAYVHAQLQLEAEAKGKRTTRQKTTVT